jgi:hypothetical protein
MHDSVIQRPDALINKLISVGIFNEDAVLGRLQFGPMKRTGLNVTMRYLVFREQEIKNVIEDHTSYDADEAFNVLCFGVVLAVTQGLTEAESPMVGKVAKVVKVLPHYMVNALLTSAKNIQKILTAN